VITIEAIAVPKAKWTTLSTGTPLSRKMDVSIGTIIPPPPTPNSPATNPMKQPISKKDDINSIVSM
jgi:hypothetical protein